MDSSRVIGLATGVISNVGQSGSMARDGEDVILIVSRRSVCRDAPHGLFFDVFQVARRSHRHSKCGSGLAGMAAAGTIFSARDCA
jgi:hypothetical protein